MRFYTFLDLMKRTCTSECIFQSYRCEAAGGASRTTLHLIVAFSKANYLCSLLPLSQILGTTPWMSDSRPNHTFSKAWVSLSPEAFLRTIYKSNKNDSIRCHNSMFKGTFSAEFEIREIDEAFLFAQMQGAWSKELASQTHIGVWTSRTLQIH